MLRVITSLVTVLVAATFIRSAGAEFETTPLLRNATILMPALPCAREEDRVRTVACEMRPEY